MAGHRHVLFASVLVAAGGCYTGAVDVGDIAETRKQEFNSEALNSAQLNGFALNGFSLNGFALNGFSLNGFALNGFALNGFSLNGFSLNGFSLNGTEFSAVFFENGEEVLRSGMDMIGGEFSLTATAEVDGQEVSEKFVLRIDDIIHDPNHDDVLLYDISVRPDGGADWAPLCVDGVPAIPLNNYWDLKTGDRIDDPNVVTFACTNAVLAKCVEWGYRPWATAERCEPHKKHHKKKCVELSLQDYHQACTRMTRADYCGNGEPWTVAGTPIDIWDHLSPPIEARGTDWPVEAEWTVDGAYCLNDIRQQTWKQQGLYPKCFLDKKGKPKKYKDCGSMKNNRALLVNAFDKYNEGMP